MTLYFSSQTGGFYDSDFHTSEMIPSDAVIITKELHREMMNGQEQGFRIRGDSNGLPYLAEHDPPTADDIRGVRDQLLKESDWTQFPDVSESTRSKWIGYRQALRDIPQQDGFPDNIIWPEKPTN